MKESDVLDLIGACNFLGIAKVTLYNYARRGEIPAFKVGRIWKFHRESLDDWVKKRITEETKKRSSKAKK